MSTKPSDYDVVVIGAGHNGLTAAAYLGRAGLRTLVLERREIVGGCAVTEEIAPGCRASTTSYIASMLRPEVIRDLDLPAYGLRMVPCEPGIQVAFPGGRVVPWWSSPQRTSEAWGQISRRDARRFLNVDAELKALARYLQPLFLEPPPAIGSRGLSGLIELFRLGKHFRGIGEKEIGRMVSFLTGSLADFLDRNFESETVKTMFVANNIYGKHGGPFQPGSALGLLFHLLSGGEHELQGFYGHVLGGMGSITQALASAARKQGVAIRTGAAVARIDSDGGRVSGVVLESGEEVSARTVVSSADPKRTFLGMVDPGELPQDFREAIEGIKMDGPCAKVNFVLGEEPRVTGMPNDADPNQRSLFTLIPSAEYAERCYDRAKLGELSDDLWVDCVVASNVDPTLAPEGKHIMTCFVQYVPYRLKAGHWDAKREWLGDRVTRIIGDYAPNVPGSVIARQVLTPLDLERTYGLTEGNIFHGDLSLEQLLFLRPVPGWSNYRMPIEGLYLGGAGAHPGGGVTGAPGYNAARRVLRDRGR